MLSLKNMSRVFVMLLIALLLSPTWTAKANDGSLALSQKETVRHLENIQTSLRTLLIDIFVGAESASLNETGAMATISHCIHSESVTYWLRDFPTQATKALAIQAVSLIYSSVTGSFSGSIIGSLEELTVNQARRIASDWLTSNNIQTAGGSLHASYSDNYQKKQKFDVEYLLTYYPEGKNQGRIVAEFRAPNPVYPPPATSRTVWDFYSWQKKGLNSLPPFIVTLNGQVKEQYGLFEWISPPQTKVEFPLEVPSLQIPDQQNLWSLITDEISSWGQEKISNLSAWIGSFLTTNSYSNDDLSELKKAVDLLEKNDQSELSPPTSDIGPALDEYLIGFIEELNNVVGNLAEVSEENKNIGKEIADIIRYNSEIIKWQAENKELSSPEQKEDPPEDPKEKSGEELEKENPELDSAEQLICSLPLSLSPTHSPVLINEIAWMGRTSSANHEWIELRNLSSETLSLKGWQLYNQSRGINIIFGEENFIHPSGFLLLVRSDDSYVPEATADYIYSGALKNQNEAIYLFDSECHLQDFVVANPDWINGDNGTKKTMERCDSLDWQTSAFVHGTPGRQNSNKNYAPPSTSYGGRSSSRTAPSVDLEAPNAHAGSDQIVDYYQNIVLDASLSSDNIGIVSYRWYFDADGFFEYQSANPTTDLEAGSLPPGEHILTLEVTDATGNVDQDEVVIIVQEIPKILINEIQIQGETNHDEFIELYNPNNRLIDLSNWRLSKKTSSGNESNLVASNSFQGVIPAYGYFLIANPQIREDGEPHYQGGEIPDIYYSGQNYYIASDNTILLYAPDESLSDRVGYGEVSDFDGSPFPESPPPGLSIGRRWLSEDYANSQNNSEDFELQPPTPRKQNISWEEEENVEDPVEEDKTIFQDGSVGFPYLLSTCQDLSRIDESLGSFYQLINDIDCHETEFWRDGLGFQPIGQSLGMPFVGDLDGRGFSISGIYIGDQDNYGGLFQKLAYPARIVNLRIEDATVLTGDYDTGLLAGMARGSSQEEIVTIEEVSVVGEITAQNLSLNAPQRIGGMVGFAQYALIHNAHSEIIINADHQSGHVSSTIGGLIGFAEYTDAQRCSSIGEINGWRNIGGLIGSTGNKVDIQRNYASVSISGEQMLGGFIGIAQNNKGIINNNYSLGNISGCLENGDNIGGFVGQSNEWIRYSYATGQVFGRNSRGFIGGKPINRTDPITNSYYDINTSGRSGKNLGATGLPTVDMFNQESFLDWDFEEVWQMSDTYPVLR